MTDSGITAILDRYEGELDIPVAVVLKWATFSDRQIAAGRRSDSDVQRAERLLVQHGFTFNESWAPE